MSGLHLRSIRVIVLVGSHQVFMALKGKGFAVKDNAGVLYPLEEGRRYLIPAKLLIN